VGCGAATRAIGACDDEVHLLCGACVEARRCPRCAAGAPPPAPARVELAAREEVVAVEGPALGGEAPAAPAVVARAAAPSSPLAAPAAPSRPAAAPRPAPAARARRHAPEERAAAPTAASPPATRPAPLVAPGRPATDATEQVAELLRTAGRPLSSADLQGATGLSAPALRAALAPLVEAGRVLRTGQTRGTRYAWRDP
jgi:hypothetical protein